MRLWRWNEGSGNTGKVKAGEQQPRTSRWPNIKELGLNEAKLKESQYPKKVSKPIQTAVFFQF